MQKVKKLAAIGAIQENDCDQAAESLEKRIST